MQTKTVPNNHKNAANKSTAKAREVRFVDKAIYRVHFKFFSPIDKFYKGITYKFFKSKIKKITRKDIFVSNLKEFDEIILIGSGKGVASVKTINQIKWKRKSLKFYKILSKHYQSAINKCPRYK